MTRISIAFRILHGCKDFRRTAPHLSMILEKCAEANKSATCPSNANIVVSVVAGILLRNCSQRVN